MEAEKFGKSMLIGESVPPITGLMSTDGAVVDLSARDSKHTVVYVFPRISQPGALPLKNWDVIPGAKGCTSQSCGFRDHHSILPSLTPKCLA